MSARRPTCASGSQSGATSNTIRFASWPSTCSAHSANDEPKGSCMTRTMRVISACTHTRSLFAASNSLLKGCSKAVSHVKSGLFGNFNKTRGAGDIDFSQVIANHIKSNQQQSTPGQTRRAGFRPEERRGGKEGGKKG